MATVRFNTSLDEHVLSYLDSEAKRIGVTRGGMISFMIEQYKTQKDSMAMVDKMQQLMQQMNDKESE
jgi:metal-responsive CopG/Arc/MetJ family transcriptional regulator